MKRIVSLMIVVCMLLAMVPAVSASSYTTSIVDGYRYNITNKSNTLCQGESLHIYGFVQEPYKYIEATLTSSDPEVAAVSGNQVTAVKPGYATITAGFSYDGEYYEHITYVIVAVSEFTITTRQPAVGDWFGPLIQCPGDAPYSLTITPGAGFDEDGYVTSGQRPRFRVDLTPNGDYQTPIVEVDALDGRYTGDVSKIRVTIDGTTYTGEELGGWFFQDYYPETAANYPQLTFSFFYTFDGADPEEAFLEKVNMLTSGEPAVGDGYTKYSDGFIAMTPLFETNSVSAELLEIGCVSFMGDKDVFTDDSILSGSTTIYNYQKDYTYRALYTLKTNNPKTYFADDTVFTVNGQPCIGQAEEGSTEVTVAYYFTVSATEVIQVMATMPAAGETFDYAARPEAVVKSGNAIVGSTDIYVVASVGNLNDPTDDMCLFPGPETYSASYYYCYKVSLMDENGDAFTVAPTVMINGKKCPVILQDGLAAAYYYFVPADEKLIETVMVEGLKAPVVGQIPDQEVTVAVNSGYGIYKLYSDVTIRWYDCTKDRMLAADETFLQGHEYSATVFVAADENASFDVFYNDGVHFYKTVGLIDGEPADIAKMSSFSADQYCALLKEFGVLERYEVNVMNGTAYDEYGNEIKKASPGQIVTVSADKGWFGYDFAQWDQAENVVFADVNAATTTFVMPANAVDIYYSTVEAEPIVINEVKLTLAGFVSGADVTMLQPNTSAEGVYIYNENGDTYALAVDKNGMPSTVVSSGKISSSGTYWLILTLHAGSGYEFGSAIANNVTLPGATKTLIGAADASAVTVAFQLPRATSMRSNSVTVTDGMATVNDQEISSATFGMKVQLIAAIPPHEDSHFSHWEITGATVEDIYSEWTTFTMGNAAVTATAVYEDYLIYSEVFFEDLMPGMPASFDPIVPSWAVYRVVEDTDEDYSFNGVLWWNIDDNTWLEPGDVFEAGKAYYAKFQLYCYDEYFFSETSFACDVNDEEAYINLEDGRTVTVLYEIVMPNSYPIKVNNGTVTDTEGNVLTMADPTQPLCLIADDAPEGKLFAYWRVDKGSVGIADPRSPETTTTMGFEPVEITAVYADPMEFDGYKYVLYADMTVDMELEGDLYVDLNGHELWGRIVTNGYKVYCFDSATDDYTYDKAGLFICSDEDGTLIAPERHIKTSPAMTGSSKRYLRIEEEGGGYSFHRFYIGVTHVNLRPSCTGLGYKAVFAGDDKVIAQLDSQQAVGFKLWTNGFPLTCYKAASEVTSLEPITLRIENIDPELYGETTVYAQLSIKLADGTEIDSVSVGRSLRDVVTYIDACYDEFTEVQLAAVRTLIAANEVMRSWNLQNL